jgi:hypothetical protein
MHKNPCQEPCGCGCGSFVLERNRYFTGKFMTARDFAGEQEYFLSRHREHNRLLHGWGVVCGLRILRHSNPECARRWVVVRAGVAIDCRGRELVLCKDTPLELPLPLEPWEEEERAQQEGAEDKDEKILKPPFLIALRYEEEEIEPVPALFNEGACDPARREANRIRETARLVFLRLDEVKPGCWREPGGRPGAPCHDDCDDELPGPAGICLEPCCPCGDAVPLAMIRPATEGGFAIDMDGRRTLPVPGDFLTHVCHINWEHGGEMTLSHLRDELHGRLEVHFDRRLRDDPGEGTGINEHTFVVQYGGIQKDLELLYGADDGTPKLEDDRVAVFHIDPDFLNRRTNLAGNVVYVTLKCDFILDCHGNPVDGDHLRGRLPTGDGIPGGTFESWFRVVADGAAKEDNR